MKVLLDENVPKQLQARIQRHEVQSVSELGWQGRADARLVVSARRQGFDALVTCDKRICRQLTEQFGSTVMPVFLLGRDSRSNHVRDLRREMPRLQQRLDRLAQSLRRIRRQMAHADGQEL